MLKISDIIKEQAKATQGSVSGGAQPTQSSGNNGAKPTQNSGSGAKPTQGSGTQPNPPAPVVSNIFDCLLKADSKIQKKPNVTDYVIYNELDKQTWIYWVDGDFSIKEKNKLSGASLFKGKWKCVADGFIIDTEDGDHYDSKTGKWKKSTGGNNSGGYTILDTTLTGDDLKNGKSVKYGMKGDVVGKIQQFLIDNGYKNVSKSGKADKIFGKRTKSSVEEFQKNNGLTVDGVVGKNTWAKLNDPKAVKKGSESTTQNSNNNTPGADLQGTGDTYVSGSDAKIFEKEIPAPLQESVKKILRKSLLKHIK